MRATSRRRPLLIVGGVLAVVLLLVLGGTAAWFFLGGSPRPAAAGYLEAWEQGDTAAMQEFLAEPDEETVATIEQFGETVGVTEASYELGDVTRRGTSATASFTATIGVRGMGEWSYEGQLAMTRAGGDWKVDWSPTALHPQLTDGARLTRERTWPERAPILAADGTPLVETSQIVVVGVQPGRVQDRAALLAALQEHAGAEPGEVAGKLDGADPDQFLPVARLPRAEYDQARPALYPIPGVLFRESFTRTPTAGAPPAVVGLVREANAEDLERLGETYEAGDRVGASGLERAHEEQLAGRPGGRIVLVGADGQPGETLQEFPAAPAEPLRTTIDLGLQAAAVSALAGAPEPAVLVALSASTGEVRAVATTPGGDSFNRAFSGRYPPGSTFKVVTAAAALQHGLTPDTPVDCPPEVTVGGRRFGNFEGGALGRVPFRTIVAESCNTAFVTIANDLPPGAFQQAAEQFGFNQEYGTRLPAIDARFPEVSSPDTVGAAALGQGQVTASPVHMASVAATVASGGWNPPRLVAVEDEGSGDGPDPTAVDPLDPQVAEQLRGLMVAAVQDGSGTAAAVPGRQIGGKTGTAEFGTGDPLPTHAWFIGYEGDLAFAVLAEDGGVGGRVAAPVAGEFLRRR